MLGNAEKLRKLRTPRRSQVPDSQLRWTLQLFLSQDWFFGEDVLASRNRSLSDRPTAIYTLA